MALGRTLHYDPGLTLHLGSSFLAVWRLQADRLTFRGLSLTAVK